MYPVAPRRFHVLRPLLVSLLLQACSAETPEGCIPVNVKFAAGDLKIYIDKPGRYCLTEDLHARIELPDHPAERFMIMIDASDVSLDLQGHTLGRGRFLTNPGASGIAITDQMRGPRKIADSKNIVIKNGVLQDFETAIVYLGTRYANSPEIPIYDPHTATYRFPKSEIVLENLTFKNNKTDFDIQVPGRLSEHSTK